MRKMKQIGIDHVLMGGGTIPWKEDELRETMDRFREEGLTIINMMIGGFPDTIYGREGRDREIAKVRESIRAAGVAGLPVIEYNFYAHRLMEGYYATAGRGGSGHTAFDYEPVKDLPPKPDVGIHYSEALWENLTYFLDAVIPVAEEAGVRMALHPNDPPIPVSHGSEQIMATLEDWKRLIGIVDSPSNGITFDPGVTREMGEYPVAVCNYFGIRDRINHAHYRNVMVEKPYVKYTEVFPDEGLVDMFNVMRELVKNGYSLGIYPEHPRALDYDREHPGGIRGGYPGGGGFAGLTYNVAYARAMLQASLSIEKSPCLT
jgi:mannonate dehydratase